MHWPEEPEPESGFGFSREFIQRASKATVVRKFIGSVREFFYNLSTDAFKRL